ncbi:peptidylprolyl isomerase [Chitinophaga alhagiae]|uniref:Peptidylprolyl isomerase n=1 Tax=Chitinophaga alhagiae TaxID=2203219 RepID=A0ABM6WBX8_9BACT|nr:peptidylprolyl isomerase [Chitinophaga alhagiae]AWO01422.1 peptidylprolyl isomerase [Chitinophaga alhagiae]
MKKFLISSFGAMLLFQAAVAQQGQKMVADKIVAKVGDKIILQSDIESAMVDMQQRALEGQPLPPNASCFAIEESIAQKVLVLQAERDSLPISEADVDGRIESQIRWAEQRYGSREKMTEVTGYTIYQLRERFRSAIRESMLANAMRDKVVNAVKVTPTEVKSNFERIPKDSLPFYESELEIGQLILLPKAGREMDKYAVDRLLELKKKVENKEGDFGTYASLYSEDPAVKENGGVYVLNRSDKTWDPDFLAAAFRLKEGEISNPVKTQFGYHLIKMNKRGGDRVTVQHILIEPNILSADLAAATHKLDSIRNLVLTRKMNFGEAVAKFSDEPMAKFNGGMLQNPQTGSTFLTIDMLDDPSTKDIVMMLDSLKPGGVSKPLPFEDERGRKGLRLVYLKTRTEPHRENLNDDYARIQARTLKEKQASALAKWLVDKMPTFYVHIEDEYRNCANITRWMAHNDAVASN